MRKTYLITGIVLIILASTMVAFQVSTENDNWICQNDEWVRRGNPDFPKPKQGCGQSYVSEQEVFSAFVRKHISQLSPIKEVLGGSFYVTDIVFEPDGKALVEYEDGHIALKAAVTYEVDGGKVRILSFQNIEDTFIRLGNLIRNNPGFKRNIWYLSYETSGAPGKSAELLFNEKTTCIVVATGDSCRLSELKPGDFVKVVGNIGKGYVEVLKIEKQ